MVAIMTYENGLKFTGKIAQTEKEAWIYLDRVYGYKVGDQWYGANRESFKVIEIETVK